MVARPSSDIEVNSMEGNLKSSPCVDAKTSSGMNLPVKLNGPKAASLEAAVCTSILNSPPPLPSS